MNLERIVSIAFFDELEKIALNKGELELLKKMIPKNLHFEINMPYKKYLKRLLSLAKEEKPYTDLLTNYFRSKAPFTAGYYNLPLYSHKKPTILIRRGIKGKEYSVPRVTGHEIGHARKYPGERAVDEYSEYVFLPKYREALRSAGLRIRF